MGTPFFFMGFPTSILFSFFFQSFLVFCLFPLGDLKFDKTELDKIKFENLSLLTLSLRECVYV
uniref:Uncharacterized protein n=1 Tax=Lotus japonicus TaxID=34305 RepID=I3SVW4_LOTJA|nr:unknown [Lotus japonicus]